MKDMISRLREQQNALAKKKGGFTLVELIVVLVILAILAAILVPTLTGYINQANTEKDYATAQTVRVAAQSVADDEYGHNALSDTTITDSDKTASGQSVTDLAGVSGVTSYSFTTDAQGKIQSGSVVINGSTYELSGNSWTATRG